MAEHLMSLEATRTRMKILAENIFRPADREEMETLYRKLISRAWRSFDPTCQCDPIDVVAGEPCCSADHHERGF